MNEWETYWKRDFASIGNEIYGIKTNDSKINYSIIYLGTNLKTIKMQFKTIENNNVNETIVIELPLQKAKKATFRPRRCYAMLDMVFELIDEEGTIAIHYEEQEK